LPVKLPLPAEERRTKRERKMTRLTLPFGLSLRGNPDGCPLPATLQALDLDSCNDDSIASQEQRPTLRNAGNGGALSVNFRSEAAKSPDARTIKRLL